MLPSLRLHTSKVVALDQNNNISIYRNTLNRAEKCMSKNYTHCPCIYHEYSTGEKQYEIEK